MKNTTSTANFLNLSSQELKKKVKKAEEIVRNCHFCEHKCHVDRTEKVGWCGVPYQPRIPTAFLHYGEEPELIPSGTVFFSGCTWKCVYCQNWDTSQEIRGEEWSPQDLADWMEKSKKRGAKNLNLVGGEPTPNIHFILKALQLSETNLPIVWNSNFYMTSEAIKLLKGVIDVWLPDFRYGSDECAERLSKINDYWKIITRNLEFAGETKERMIIRLLVLPGHVGCCAKPILKWISENLGDYPTVNIMRQYRPVYKASEYSEINRRLTGEEYREVLDYAEELGLDNILIQ